MISVKYSKFSIDTFNTCTFWEMGYIKVFAQRWQQQQS